MVRIFPPVPSLLAPVDERSHETGSRPKESLSTTLLSLQLQKTKGLVQYTTQRADGIVIPALRSCPRQDKLSNVTRPSHHFLHPLVPMWDEHERWIIHSAVSSDCVLQGAGAGAGACDMWHDVLTA